MAVCFCSDRDKFRVNIFTSIVVCPATAYTLTRFLIYYSANYNR